MPNPIEYWACVPPLTEKPCDRNMKPLQRRIAECKGCPRLDIRILARNYTMTLTQKALRMATKAHKGQNRKFGEGEAYITHPIAVSDSVEGKDAKIVALLHDVVEDTPLTLEDLHKEFPLDIVWAVDMLTKRDCDSYAESVLRAKSNRLARRVKIADIKHNMSTLPEGHGLVDRYIDALNILEGK